MKKEIREDLGKIFYSFSTARLYFEYAKYLHKPDTKEELLAICNNRFLNEACHVYLRVAIIELCKLYIEPKEQSNQMFNIPKFLKKFKQGNHWSKANIDQTLLIKWEENIEFNKEFIRAINKLRDELYAHTDRQKPDLNQFGNNFFDELSNLIELAEDIIQTINLNIDGYHLQPRTLYNKDDMDVIKNHATYEAMQIKKEWDERNDNN